MTKYYAAKIQLNDAKADNKRRYRHILAASGKILESGEIRDLEHLYVMGHDGELYRIHDLAKNPDAQKEVYAVKAQADHGELVDGELIPSIEKQFGSCKVWLEDDGLHARMYFANNDALADHAWAISEDASYSTGIDWYPDGYYGAGQEIDEAIGILREISMVLTGNDPRAKTIDTKSGKGSTGAAVGDNKSNKKGKTMGKTIDELTPDERIAMERKMGEAINGVIAEFTTSAPESETEPTARDTKDNTDEGKKPSEDDGAANKTTDGKTKITTTTDNSPNGRQVLIIKERSTDLKARQEEGAAHTTKDWRFSDEAKRKFADMARSFNGFRHGFASAWRDELKKHGATTNDGITGLSLPVDTRSLFIDALEKSDGLISHFDELGGKSYLIRLLTAADGINAETARAGGFTKGDTKIFQKLLATPRTVYNKMVYKMLDLDALELWENPNLVEVRARELVQALIVEVERAAIRGDGRTEPAEGQADRRMFDGTRGFYSILSDAQATEGFGQLMATSVTMPAGSNLYDASIEADSEIESEGGLIYVTKKSVVKALRQAKKSSTSNEPLIEPGTRIEDLLGAERVYTPAWMADAPVDVIVFANKSYGLIGEANATMRPEFKTETNQNVLLAEFPRGGSLKAYKSAVAITFAEAAAASTKASSK